MWVLWKRRSERTYINNLVHVIGNYQNRQLRKRTIIMTYYLFVPSEVPSTAACIAGEDVQSHAPMTVA